MAETPQNLTPMLVQYLEIKRRHADAILFYRMGDFYEMFFEDAVKAAPVLEVQLTARDKNSAQPIPLCGVPYHAAQGYVQKLLAKGFKVAIAEQLDEPTPGKGIVRRDVVRIVTPSLIGDPELVPEESRNYLVALAERKNGVEVSVLDLLASSLRHGTLDQYEALEDLFTELLPKEILVEGESKIASALKTRFPSILVTIRPDYFASSKAGGTRAALEAYLRETQKTDTLPPLGDSIPLFEARTLALDPVSAASLEIVRSATGATGTSLADILDFTETPMGRRLLRDWLLRPSTDLKEIEGRLSAVENLAFDAPLAEALTSSLSQIRDLERLNTKTALGLAMPRDLVTIRSILGQLPAIRSTLGRAKAPWLRTRSEKLDPLPELCRLLESALEDQAPATLRDGGIFRSEYRPEIAEYRGLSHDAKGTIAAIETRERTRTGISSLKIKYSRVFGYTIEITNSHLAKVPSDYHRKQTIAGGERFVTEELKKFEERVISAEHKLKSLEESLFLELRGKVAREAETLLADARLLAELDVVASFARAARERGYRRPAFNRDRRLDIVDGRHPVIETLLPHGRFVPNSMRFADGECRTLIITGPNMGGKSTIMRQVALIALMGQAGSFVPAASAELPLLDAVFTRIGASDDLARGRSTFMVEMTEVSRILNKATPRSLVLIDEIGRGTSTYDGLSLAWSLLEHLHREVRATTLFATHFHEVTSLEKHLPELKNASVLVEKWREDIVFLYKLGPGICNQSYGIDVAKLAGLPDSVLSRSREILGFLESQAQRGMRARNRALEIHDNQMAFFDPPKPAENLTGIES